MTTHAATLTLGSPFSPSTTLGPLQNAMQYAKVRSLLADCKTHGYEFATTTDEDSLPSKGYFIPPTLISNPPSTSLIMTSEQFGPILPVQPWSDEDDVVRRTNDTKTGLGACIWSKDLEVAERIARRLEVGSVYINSALRPDWRVWFAGQKESGIGGERGARGLLEYCNAQAVHVYR